MNEWHWLLLFAVAGISFLAGRWNGIKHFDREMVKAGLLPPLKEDSDAS